MDRVLRSGANHLSQTYRHIVHQDSISYLSKNTYGVMTKVTHFTIIILPRRTKAL